MIETKNIKRQFFNALKRGTGEAYLIAKGNPNINFSRYIIKGALKNYAYDGQAESSRAQYIYDLISLSNSKDKIRASILQGIEKESNDTWSLTHLFDLVKILAKQGDEEAKQAIYNRFLHNPIDSSDWVGFTEILELDGLSGLLFIVEKYGKALKKNPDDWQNIDVDFIVKIFQKENPQINVHDKLEDAADSNPFIKICLKNIKKIEKQRKSKTRRTRKFDDIVDEILNGEHLLSYKKIKKLSDPEILKIAMRLQTERNKNYQERLLYVFSFYKFPLDSKLILNLAKQKPTSKNRIAEFAISALKYLNNEEIGAFALKKMLTAKHPAVYTDILISNYVKGYSELLTNLVKRFKNEHIIEALASSYIDIYEANKTKECKEPLEELYKKMNCGIHRNSLIEILIENNVLSDKLRDEIKYDSNLETRELFNKK